MKKLSKKILRIMLLIIVTTSGCLEAETMVPEKAKKLLPKFADEIAKLPKIDPSSLESYEGFKGSLNSVNSIIMILNREGGLELEELDIKFETYRKISRVATEYGPLIDNYNEVVLTAKEFEEGNSEKEYAFYMAIGKFGVEAFLIVTIAYYGVAYTTTGYLYRASGLNRLAFTHPTIISIVLNKTHWAIRGGLSEKSSEFAEITIETGKQFADSPGKKLEEIKGDIKNIFDNTTNWVGWQLGQTIRQNG